MCVRACVRARMHVFVCACRYVCVYIYVHICVCAFVWQNICTGTVCFPSSSSSALFSLEISLGFRICMDESPWLSMFMKQEPPT